MKKVYFLILIISCSFVACKKDAITSKFDDSYAAWRIFRAKNNNSYNYVSYNVSAFGYHTETKITIKNGNIIAREFSSQVYSSNGDGSLITTTWTESEGSLNTHADGAAELLTLDQIYNKAQTIWLKADTKTNDVYFDTDAGGLIASAGYVPKGCVDDCFRGVNIKDINPL